MLGVLQHAGFDSPVGQGLAIGGETGTLIDAFGDTAVAGRIRGKTGTLNNPPFDQDPPAVKALSGYMPVDGGGAIEYTLLLNGPTISDQSEYRPIWDDAGDGPHLVPGRRQPGRARPAMTGSGDAVEARRQLALLAALAAVPAVVLAGTWQYADVEVPPPTTTTTTLAPPPPTRRARHRSAVDAAATDTAGRAGGRRRGDGVGRRAVRSTLLDRVGEGRASRRHRRRHGDRRGRQRHRRSSPPAIRSCSSQRSPSTCSAGDYRFRTELQSAPPVDGVIDGQRVPRRWRRPGARAPPTCADPLPLSGVQHDLPRAARRSAGRARHHHRSTATSSATAAATTTSSGVEAWGDAIGNAEAGPYDALLVNDGLISAEQLRARTQPGGGPHLLRPADSARHRGQRVGRQRRPAGRRRAHDAGVDRVAAARRRAGRDAPYQRQQHRRADAQGDRVRGSRAGHATSRARGRAIDARRLGGAARRRRAARRVGTRAATTGLTCTALSALVSTAPVGRELASICCPPQGVTARSSDQLLGTPAEGRMAPRPAR